MHFDGCHNEPSGSSIKDYKEDGYHDLFLILLYL